MNRLPLTAALADYDHVRDLALGRVVAEGIQLNCLTLPVEEIFYRFLVYREWEVSELSLAKYVSMRAQGNDFCTALPIFPSRIFRHSSLFVHVDGPIKSVGDLVGKRVGLPEWAQTASVYSRGFLSHQYGLDLASIHWFQAGVNQPGRAEKVELSLPKGVQVTKVPDRSLNDMLLSKDLDAVLTARPPTAFVKGDPRIRRFFNDFIDVERAYYQDTKVFPIMHAVVVRNDVLKSHPWIARNLYVAFDEARRRSIERVCDGAVSMVPIPWGSEYARAGKESFGEDYFPYGVELNRGTLQTFLNYAHEQGVCSRLLSVEELFPEQLLSSHRV
jgi:4,5-dihydroxyphthalate decarboxylase